MINQSNDVIKEKQLSCQEKISENKAKIIDSSGGYVLWFSGCNGHMFTLWYFQLVKTQKKGWK